MNVQVVGAWSAWTIGGSVHGPFALHPLEAPTLDAVSASEPDCVKRVGYGVMIGRYGPG